MAKIGRTVEVRGSDHKDSEALGDNSNEFNALDVGMPVKMSGDTSVPCADGDELEGFVATVETYTTEGHSFGAVKRNNRVEAKNSATVITIGKHVCAGVQAALGAGGGGVVRDVLAVPNVVFDWWCVGLLNGTGQVGEVILIERI